MAEITASYADLFEQAKDVTAMYMHNANREIDDLFGKGYAAEHPEILISYMQIASRDFHVSASHKLSHDASESILSLLEDYLHQKTTN